MNASATARFDEEWVIELLTHVKNMIIAAKDWVIRNLDNISDNQEWDWEDLTRRGI
jgi:hypothetical protein